MLHRKEFSSSTKTGVNLISNEHCVVGLCELTELSYEEAAAVMGCPVGTVRSRLHRARRMLLERLVEKGIHGVH